MQSNSTSGFWRTIALFVVVSFLATASGCGDKKSTKTSSSNKGDGKQTTPKAPAGIDDIKEGAIVTIDGSSTVFPVSEAVAEEFQKAVGGRAKVTVGTSGTGGGFKKFCRGEIDISDASRPISTEEMALAKENGIEYIELPICFDALTVVVNAQNDWVDSITVDELKKNWEPAAKDKITKWNQVRADWPDEELRLYGPGTDSGTFDYFTEAINGKAKASRSDYTQSEDDNTLVQGIQGNRSGLGYFGFAYYEPNKDKLKALAVKKGDKPPVKPSTSTVLDGTYDPLSRPLFIYVSKKSAEKPEVKAFVEFYMNNAKSLAAEVNYVPLPDNAYEVAKSRFEKRQVGTGFGGKGAVGLRIEDVLKREPKS